MVRHDSRYFFMWNSRKFMWGLVSTRWEHKLGVLETQASSGKVVVSFLCNFTAMGIPSRNQTGQWKTTYSFIVPLKPPFRGIYQLACLMT
jgi:hypothetical protein